MSIINGYYTRSEADVIAALMISPVPDLKNHRQFLTRMETGGASTQKSTATNDRWIFECSSAGTYIRFLGTEFGIPCDPWSEHCRIVITYHEHAIVVDINGENIYESWCNCKDRWELHIDRYATLNTNGELIVQPAHGLFFNAKPTCVRPFDRRSLAELRRQLAGITHHLREDDVWHDLFTKVCDLADRTISDWYF